jgi:hypothetical protein
MNYQLTRRSLFGTGNLGHINYELSVTRRSLFGIGNLGHINYVELALEVQHIVLRKVTVHLYICVYV